jgi:hypothetical protein
MKLSLFLGVSICIISCETPSESVTTNININEVWFAELIDTDSDGYYSDANLYFNLKTNANNTKVFVNLGIRKSSDDPSDLYELCFESEDLTLNKDGDNIWYIPVRNINYHLEQNNYDFLLRVYKSENPESIADEISPSEDTDLYNIALESDSTDLNTKWITYIDDDLFESNFTYYPRVPVGASYVSLAEKFEKPAQSGYFKLLEVRIHLPYIYSGSTDIGLSIRDDNDNEPNEIIGSYLFSTSTTGWNQIKWEYDLTEHDVFYISLAPSVNYAVSLDTNSVNQNGYGLWYVASNPPSYSWKELDNNIAVEIFVGYSLVNNLSKLNQSSSSTKMCRHRYQGY